MSRALRAGLSYLALGLTISLAGQASAQSQPPEPAPLWPDLSKSAKVDRDGSHDAAVIVGIEKYHPLPHVDGAVDNASLWYSYLIGDRGVPETNIRFLKDNEATEKTIPAALEWATTRAKDDGKIWFVYIGHGAPGPDGGVLVGYDAQQTEESIASRSVPLSTVLITLSKSAAKPVLVIDSCFSGLTGRYDDQSRPITTGTQPVIPSAIVNPTFAVVMTAGKSNEYAGRLPGTSRPAFSYLMLGAMRGWADTDHDGTVTSEEAVSYTRQNLAILPIHRSQTPEQNPVDANLALAKGVSESGPSISGIIAKLPADDADLDKLNPKPPPPPPPQVVTPPVFNVMVTTPPQKEEKKSSALPWILLGTGVLVAGLVVGGIVLAGAGKTDTRTIGPTTGSMGGINLATFR